MSRLCSPGSATSASRTSSSPTPIAIIRRRRAPAEAAVEEGGDWGFVPDIALRDGERVSGPGWELEAVHTPGHTSNHLCFAWPEHGILFSGDHVMGWSTSVIAPPDGDM